MTVGMFQFTLPTESSMNSRGEQASAGCLNMRTATMMSTSSS
jgi:hypothetical protein